MSVREPLIIEDDECELCLERALPYDDATDLPYCAQHKTEMYTNVSLGDFTPPRPDIEIQIELSKLTRPVMDETPCQGYACGHRGTSRLSPYDWMSITMDACVECAQEYWTEPYLPDEDWLIDLTMEVDTNAELEL